MSSERGLWNAVRPAMTPYMRLVRVENKTEKGTPDVYWRARGNDVSGWMELKEEKPPMPRAPIHCGSLKLEQVMWAEEETAVGGRASLLLQLGREYYLLRPEAIRRLYEGQLYRYDPRGVVLLKGTSGFPVTALYHALVFDKVAA